MSAYNAADVRVSLRPVTVENWQACAALSVAPDQAGFVPTNLYSIAEAQFYPDAQSRAIYDEYGTLVGYALYGRDSITTNWKIFRLMIDAGYQCKGYGAAALREILAEISAKSDGSKILICYHNANHVARRLYARFGFVGSDIDESGKVTAIWRAP